MYYILDKKLMEHRASKGDCIMKHVLAIIISTFLGLEKQASNRIYKNEVDTIPADEEEPYSWWFWY